MFLAPKFFGGSTPEFLKSIYKIQPDCDHVAKFQGDRLRGLGESVAKKNITGKSPSGTAVPGGLMILTYHFARIARRQLFFSINILSTKTRTMSIVL